MLKLQRLWVLWVCLLGVPASAGDFIYTVGHQLNAENTIFGFLIKSDGTLHETAGSPYATGGSSGKGTPSFTQNGIVASADGQFVFSCNHLSNDISIFKVRHNGRLDLLNVVPTGGYMPASIAIFEDILYVSHLGTSFAACYHCDYRGFRFDRETADLIPIPDSVIPLPLNPPGFALAIQFTPNGRYMVTTRFTESKLDSFELDTDSGLLTPTVHSPCKAEDSQPIGFAFNPAKPNQFYVSNLRELDRQPGTMAAFTINSVGDITLVPGGPYATGDAGTASWVAIASNGKDLYTSNTSADSIAHFKIRNNGTLILERVVQVPNIDEENDAPHDVIITQDDRFLYTVNCGVPGIVGFEIQEDGNLVLLPGRQPNKLPEEKTPFGSVYVQR